MLPLILCIVYSHHWTNIGRHVIHNNKKDYGTHFLYSSILAFLSNVSGMVINRGSLITISRPR